MGGMFSKPKMPTPIPQPIIPTENASAIQDAKQKQMEGMAAQTGRASTILSQNDISKTDTMG